MQIDFYYYLVYLVLNQNKFLFPPTIFQIAQYYKTQDTVKFRTNKRET